MMSTWNVLILRFIPTKGTTPFPFSEPDFFAQPAYTTYSQAPRSATP